MAREGDIRLAFVQSIRIDAKGRRYLKTADFVNRLETFNWHWSLRQANAWIERYQTYFVDKTNTETDNRTWWLRNMGRIS